MVDLNRRAISRRHAVAGLGAAVAVGAVGISTASRVGASPVSGATMTVWQLEPDWGYARGPHAKTRLVSRASRSAAAHRYALTQAQAELMNLHLCSSAPAVPLEVDAEAFAQLWDDLAYEWNNPWANVDVRVFDDRHAVRLVGGPQKLAMALAPSSGAVGTADPDAGSTPGSSAPDSPAGQPDAHQNAGESVEGMSNASTAGASSPAALAFTGSASRSMAAGALAALVAGVVTLRGSRHAAVDAVAADERDRRPSIG